MLLTAAVCKHLDLTPAHVVLKRRFVARCLLYQQVGHLPYTGSHISLLVVTVQAARVINRKWRVQCATELICVCFSAANYSSEYFVVAGSDMKQSVV
jgi:hypothetical protein